MSGPSAPRWVGDTRIGWRILLTAEPVAAGALDRETLGARLRSLYVTQGWGPAPAVVESGSPDRLLGTLVAASAAPLVVGIAPARADGPAAPRCVVLSAHHGAADGLALLRVLEHLGLGPVTTTARGVDDRPSDTGLARAVLRRLGEVVLRPPARVTTPAGHRGGAGDVVVRREVPGRFRTADLVHAAARGVVAHEAGHGRTARRVAVAVGAGRAGEPSRIDDRSALLRLRDVELLDREEVARQVRTAPLQVPPAAGTARPWTPYADRVLSLGIRLLAPRLGSTLLVSHLGEVDAPAAGALAFYPVTAGGTGLSLGAVGLPGRGTTVVTLRGRAARWTDDGLEQLLEAVISLL
ncbi:hypothetical protein [Nocardioides sp. SYSU DS0651]|uniref:hypothetical protein n=1 Tax=Nocardioides sp. SYSU DS0651 TaxID=3415955 RepID=UPI003F4C165C